MTSRFESHDCRFPIAGSQNMGRMVFGMRDGPPGKQWFARATVEDGDGRELAACAAIVGLPSMAAARQVAEDMAIELERERTRKGIECTQK